MKTLILSSAAALWLTACTGYNNSAPNISAAEKQQRVQNINAIEYEADQNRRRRMMDNADAINRAYGDRDVYIR